MKLNHTYVLLFFILALISCRKDVDQFIPQPTNSDPLLVSGTVLGKVLSDEGAAVAGAGISFHGNLTISDNSGFFYLPDVQAPQLNALLEVQMDGFFPAYRRLPWTAQTQIQTDIYLITKTLTGAISVESGGDLELNGGMQIGFPAGALQYPTGDPATGEAQVYAYWLDPSDPSFSKWNTMGVKGVDPMGNTRFLQSFGILVLDLTDSNGLPLRVAPGKNLELRFPVPAAMAASAPATLDLWSFNPQAGAWETASSASLFNQTYTAKAATGQYWNVATSQPLVQVRGWTQLPDGSSAGGVYFRVEGTDGWVLGEGQTQNQGQFAFDFPANTPASLKLLDFCGAEKYSQSLPALTGNVSLNPIPWPASDVVKVDGILLDCEEKPVAAGFVQVLWAAQEWLLPLKDGAFHAQLPLCPDQVLTLIGFDLVRHYQTTPLAFSSNAPVDAGNWVLCNDTPEYISFNLDGEVQFSDMPDLTVNGQVSTITETDLGLVLSFAGTSPGTFQVLSPDFALGSLSGQNVGSVDLILNISRFDPPGGYVIGSFNGKATDGSAVEHQISGVFKLQRD